MFSPCWKVPTLLLLLLSAIACVCICGCSRKGSMFDLQENDPIADVHSFAKPEEWKNTFLILKLNVDFERKVLAGTAELSLDRGAGDVAESVILDSRDLKIQKAEFTTDNHRNAWESADFALGTSDPILGAPLRVKIPASTKAIRITYETSPGAVALQWLSPAQTADKKQPFLFSQSQAIQARSWIPLQDSPGIRMQYVANITAPKGLRAVMSANMNPNRDREDENRAEEEANAGKKASDEGATTREFGFHQSREIPPYLIALAVGDLAFANLDPSAREAEKLAEGRDEDGRTRRPEIKGRTGVYAEPSIIDVAAKEFEDTEQMLKVAEQRFSRYRWGRYDLLILPPSFPFGGMENPSLTFATPTVIAGDKSLVSLVAHELAHSWSGNLVTNATWRDFWLNEGVTTYIERRIIEDLYGKGRADMEAVLGYQTLLEEMKDLPEKDEILYVDLKGRDPDEGFTNVPYEKGALFLRTLEEVVGRDKFDDFLRSYFNHNAFQSITTQDFLNQLEQFFFRTDPKLETKIPILEWVTKPGIPQGAAIPKSGLLSQVNAVASEFAAGTRNAKATEFERWSSQEQLSFLRALPKDVGALKMRALDEAWRITASGNSELVSEWLLMSARNEYRPAYPRLERFLVEVGRRRFIEPLYKELVKTQDGRTMAVEIYAKARQGYHPMAVATVDGIVKP